VTLTPLGNGAPSRAGVASGSIDIGVGNVITIESAHRRAYAHVIAPARTTQQRAVQRADRGEELAAAHGKDLNGKVVATNPLRHRRSSHRRVGR